MTLESTPAEGLPAPPATDPSQAATPGIEHGPAATGGSATGSTIDFGTLTNPAADPAMSTLSGDAVPGSAAAHSRMADSAMTSEVDILPAPPSMPPVFAAVIVTLFLVALWTATSLVLAELGWSAFARRYQSRRFDGTASCVATSVSFHRAFTSYHNSVRVALTEDGVHLASTSRYLWFHRSFVVPWTSVVAVRRKESHSGRRYRLEIEDPAGKILIKIHSEIGATIHSYWPAKPAAENTQQNAA